MLCFGWIGVTANFEAPWKGSEKTYGALLPFNLRQYLRETSKNLRCHW